MAKSKYIYNQVKWKKFQTLLLECMMVLVLLLGYTPFVEMPIQIQTHPWKYHFKDFEVSVSVEAPRRRQRDFIQNGAARRISLSMIK